MNFNKTICVIVVGVIAFLAIVVAGKLVLEKDCHHHKHHCPPEQQQQEQEQQQQPPTVPVMPPPVAPYPYYVPEFHNNQHFWAGYNDGWNAIPRRLATPEYERGYEIGAHDRVMGRHYYFDRYYPPGFTLRLPGFRLHIR